MSRFRRFDIVERCPSHFLNETTIFTSPKTLVLNPWFPAFPFVEDEANYSLDLLDFHHPPSILVDELDTVTDLIQIHNTPMCTSTHRVTRRVGFGEQQLQTLCDRVSDLELAFEQLVREEKGRKKKTDERKYTWTAEIQTSEKDRKYKWTAEIKGGKDEKKGYEKSYKCTAEIKRKGCEYLPLERTYTVKVSSGSGSEKKKKKCEKVTEKGKSVGSAARIVEIEEPSEHGGIVLRQVFTKRLEKKRGKSKELSPEYAAALIQMSFRTYLIRRSQALRALRELAIAKIKLKEVRALLNNFTYRRRLSRDAEERQRFSKKIIVLLLTVDAIEGVDLMVRAAKKSMVDELEAMLDMVDPQPEGKFVSMMRRSFDMPDGVINKELAAGVAQVVQMLDEE